MSTHTVLLTAMKHAHAGFKLQGEHESERFIDHCTIETFESMQSTEESVTVVNPGLRFKNVRSIPSIP